MGRNKARQKGNRTIAKGKEILFAEGYIGSNLEKTGRFVKEKDLFGLWDWLFIKKRNFLFIQFKTNKEFGIRKPRKWVLPYLEFGKKHGNRYVKFEIWSKPDRKPFLVFECK